MLKQRIIALLIILASGIGSYFFIQSLSYKPFQLGLDLSGGVSLLYQADISTLPEESREDSLLALRDVIERRVNMFGIAEPTVQTETVRVGQEAKEYRLVVELPGVSDIDEAIQMIGDTPVLEFRTEALVEVSDEIVKSFEGFSLAQQYEPSPLTGRYLESARLEFSQPTQGGFAGQPIVALKFNAEGARIFGELTRENIGKTIAIYLDGSIISAPMVQQEITGGEAVITGDFTPDEAKSLVGRLNSGALPVPIQLIGTDIVGPSLGQDAINSGIFAGIVSSIGIAIFLIFYYRLPGLIASLALGIYVLIVLFIFRELPVTLTAPGIAGFVISLGMAVDANILIFERMKEELLSGKTTADALKIGFDRAWLSIRDGNVSSILSAVVLFWFGTSLIKGFALTFGVGIIISMLTAITVSRYLLRGIGDWGDTRVGVWLMRPFIR